MKSIIKEFWYNLLEKLNENINQRLNKRNNIKIIEAGDDTKVNFFVMVLKKVLNRVLMGAEFDIVSDSIQADPLKELCKNINENIYKITSYMLSGKEHSECWVVPSFITIGGKAKLIHTYLEGYRCCITAMKNNDEISDCYMILSVVERKNKIYLLCRRHTLNENGDLTISYFIGDNQARKIIADVPEWDSFLTNEITYRGVNNIGFGRYKSPVIAYGSDTVYGVPLNYGCGVIEKDIETTLQQIRNEFKHKDVRLFAHESIVKQEGDGKKRKNIIDEFIYLMRPKISDTGKMIEEYSPSIREISYYTHLEKQVEQYQNQMGVTELITHNQSGNGATATEVKGLNTDNIALEESIRKAIRKGNIMTLEADSLYLGISREFWDYDETWKDIYEDEQQTLQNNLTVYQSGGQSQRDFIKYWFPTLDDKGIDDKIAEIKQEKADNTQKSLEDILTM